MELRDNSRQARLFFWSLGIWDEFTEKDSSCLFEKRTNLCHFVRVIFFYTPLVFFLHFLLITAAIFSVFILPFIFFGWKNVSIVGGGGSVFIIALVAMIIWQGGRRATRRMTEDQQVAPRKTTKREPSFLKILWQWVIAVKKGICPEVTFYKAEEARKNA